MCARCSATGHLLLLSVLPHNHNLPQQHRYHTSHIISHITAVYRHHEYSATCLPETPQRITSSSASIIIYSWWHDARRLSYHASSWTCRAATRTLRNIVSTAFSHLGLKVRNGQFIGHYPRILFPSKRKFNCSCLEILFGEGSLGLLVEAGR